MKVVLNSENNLPTDSKKYINTNQSNNSEVLYYGKWEFKNKIIYIGTYKDSASGIFRHGKGKVLHPTSETFKGYQESYEGDWVEDKMHGYGLYHYSCGDIYQGEFQNNQHHGFGKYYFTDGSRYEGEWKNHKMDGSGKYYDINGVLWEGEFREGEYLSKEQARLREDKRINKKIVKIKSNLKDFLYKWQIKFQESNKKTYNENLKGFFPFANQIAAYVDGPYPQLNDFSPQEWNDLFSEMLLNYDDGLEINVPKDIQEIKHLPKNRVYAAQLQDEITSGQVIEATLHKISNSGNNTTSIAIAYSKEYDKWLVVFHDKK